MNKFLKSVLIALGLIQISFPVLSTDLSNTIECVAPNRVWRDPFENLLHRNLHHGTFILYHTEERGVNPCNSRERARLGTATLFGTKGWVVTSEHLFIDNYRFLDIDGFFIRTDDKSECYALDAKYRVKPASDIDLVLVKVKEPSQFVTDGGFHYRYIPKIHFGYAKLSQYASELKGMAFEEVDTSHVHDLETYAKAVASNGSNVATYVLPNRRDSHIAGKSGHSGTALFDASGMAYAVYKGLGPSEKKLLFVPFSYVKNQVLESPEVFFNLGSLSASSLYTSSIRDLNGVLGDLSGKSSILGGALLSEQEKLTLSLGSLGDNEQAIFAAFYSYIDDNGLPHLLSSNPPYVKLYNKLTFFIGCNYDGTEIDQVGHFLTALKDVQATRELPMMRRPGPIGASSALGITEVSPSSAPAFSLANTKNTKAKESIMKLVNHIRLAYRNAAVAQKSADPRLEASLIRKNLSFDQVGGKLASVFNIKGKFGNIFSKGEVSKRHGMNVDRLIKIESEMSRDSSIFTQKSREFNAKSVVKIAGFLPNLKVGNQGLANSIKIYTEQAVGRLNGRLGREVEVLRQKVSVPIDSNLFEMGRRLNPTVSLGSDLNLSPDLVGAIRELNSLDGRIIIQGEQGL